MHYEINNFQSVDISKKKCFQNDKGRLFTLISMNQLRPKTSVSDETEAMPKSKYWMLL